MSRQKLIALTLAALLAAPTVAFAADDTPPKLDRPAEIVVIGSGEIMDAVQRAVEEEVAIINEDGGVMGQPLKVTRANDHCRISTPTDASVRARGIAARQPILIFQDFCENSGLEALSEYARRNILFMGVGRWPAELTEERAGPTVFRMGPNHLYAQEMAFHLASSGNNQFDLIFAGAVRREVEQIEAELLRGFAATTNESSRWGKLLASISPKITLREVTSGHTISFFEPISDLANPILLIADWRVHGTHSILQYSKLGWRGKAVVPHLSSFIKKQRAGREHPFKALPIGIQYLSLDIQPFYLGPPPAGAKAYTAFHPDWVAGFWQVMKAVKYAKSLDGREIAKTLGGKPFFSRAPWLMLQTRGRYRPPELLQRFNDNGDLRMAGYKLEKVWPKE